MLQFRPLGLLSACAPLRPVTGRGPQHGSLPRMKRILRRNGLQRMLLHMNREALVDRLLELRHEIAELERGGQAYLARRMHSPFDRHVQDQRILRLEEIRSELERLAAGHSKETDGRSRDIRYS